MIEKGETVGPVLAVVVAWVAICAAAMWFAVLPSIGLLWLFGWLK